MYDTFGLGVAKNLCLLTLIVIKARTVTLWKLKDYVGAELENTDVQSSSHYRRLTRFMNDCSGNLALMNAIGQLCFRTLRGLKFTHLLLDGTSWQRGDTKYHYMVLSVVVGSVAVPIYWKQLSKIGASNQEERIELMKEAMDRFDLSNITLLADREYIGKDWFKFLKTNNIDFVIRLKFCDFYLAVDQKNGRTYQEMYDRCKKPGKMDYKQIELDGKSYYLSMINNPKKDAKEKVIIFITIKRPSKIMLRQYTKRWRIECLFHHLKTNGFNLEDINLADAAKNNLMMAIVSLAYALTIKAGWKKRKSVRSIKYKDGTSYPAESVFRMGLSEVLNYCRNFMVFLTYLKSAFLGREHTIWKNVQ
ncbi:MAG: transposase [Chloroflexia bacterium]|nr:transposase [Chloroflexia bacterium]